MGGGVSQHAMGQTRVSPWEINNEFSYRHRSHKSSKKSRRDKESRGANDDDEIARANALRAKLGMAPLKTHPAYLRDTINKRAVRILLDKRFSMSFILAVKYL